MIQFRGKFQCNHVGGFAVAFFAAFVFVFSILVFEVYLHQGKMRGNVALLVALVIAMISSVALVFFGLGVIHGGQIVAG